MALYFPVSALVTLFGNILQNPNDPRARSDTRLMNLVVTFLSTLVVIDKAERDASSRKKRKPAELNRHPRDNANLSAASTTTPRPTSSTSTPTMNVYGDNGRNNPTVAQLSPKFNGEQNRQNNASAATTPSSTSQVNGNANGYSPMNTAISATGSAPRGDAGGWPSEQFDPVEMGSFAELTGFGQPMASPSTILGSMGMSGITPGLAAAGVSAPGHQPTLPQDLWQLPMTLDWDWAEFTGGAYPGFENGSTI